MRSPRSRPPQAVGNGGNASNQSTRHFKDFGYTLREDQQRELSWMLKQEAGKGTSQIEFTNLAWREPCPLSINFRSASEYRLDDAVTRIKAFIEHFS